MMRTAKDTKVFTQDGIMDLELVTLNIIIQKTAVQPQNTFHFLKPESNKAYIKYIMAHDFYKLRLSQQEVAIYEIARAYYYFIRKRNKQYAISFYTCNDPRQHKDWQSFADLYEVIKNDGFFDPFWFVEAQLKNLPQGKMLWPRQLLTKKAIQNYTNYVNDRKVVVKSDKVKDIMYALAQDKKLISEWFAHHSTQNYAELFQHIPQGLLFSDGIYYAMQGMLSIFFLGISKTFLETYKDLDPDVQQEIADRMELARARNKVREHEKLRQFARKHFTGEVIV